MNPATTISNSKALPRRVKSNFVCGILPALLVLFTLQSTHAGSATWKLNPNSGDWNTAANWMPNTVPNGTADAATFGVSNTTSVNLSADAEVNSIVFSPGASAFIIAPQPGFRLTISGAGAVNHSGSTQNFFATFAPQGPNGLQGIIEFAGASSAGDQVVVTNQGGSVAGFGGSGTLFTGTATAGNATFVNQGASVEFAGGGFVEFLDSSSAGNGIFINSDDAVDGAHPGNMIFLDTSTAANGTFINEPGGGNITFLESSTAGNGIFLCKGNPVSGVEYSQVQINGDASAGQATFTLEGGEANGADGAHAQFGGAASGGDSTFILNGGSVEGALGAGLHFQVASFGDRPNAGHATVIANGGSNGGEGATIVFVDSSLGTSSGGTSRIEVFGNGSLDISLHSRPLTIGSLEGDGRVFLGGEQLSTGKRMGTTFSGVIQDGGIVAGTGGSLTKTGQGTFELSGANTYTGGTTVSAGTLVVRNTSGSGTGTGTVSVNAGTLGGSGIISGAVTVGTGSGGGAFLAPASGSPKQATLTLQSSLTFQADATYTYTFKGRTNQTRGDLVRANGVAINGATVALQGETQGTLTTGTLLTLIRNKSANPISGTFSNLPDGAIVNVSGNNLQASYTGGDGNDLTLTAVP